MHHKRYNVISMTLHYVFALWHNASTLWRQVITFDSYLSVLIGNRYSFLSLSPLSAHRDCYGYSKLFLETEQASVTDSKRKRYLCNNRPLPNPGRKVQILPRLTMPAPRQRMPPQAGSPTYLVSRTQIGEIRTVSYLGNSDLVINIFIYFKVYIHSPSQPETVIVIAL
jgi:hypothetical protein